MSALRVALEARKLGPISINVRLTAVRKLAVEAADNGLLAPDAGPNTRASKAFERRESVPATGFQSARCAGSLKRARYRDSEGSVGRAILAVLLGCGLRRSRGGGAGTRPHPVAGWPLVRC